MAEIESTQAQPVKTTTNVLYLLHALAPFTAWILAVVAIVIGMVTRDDVRGTYLESHYSWLARTFWWGLLWIAISCVVTAVLFVTIVGIIFIWIPWTILFLWYLYRVLRGWLLLSDGKPALGFP